MTTSTKVKSFIKEFVSAVKGDDAEAQAQKVLRHADSALKRQIASLEGDTIILEEEVAKVIENKSKARINYGKLIEDRDQYVTNLLIAKNKITEAEEALETHKEKIAFLKAELTALDEEVEG